MHLHKVEPSERRIIENVRGQDGGRILLAVGKVDGRDCVALVGHEPPYNVGEQRPPVCWYMASPYSSKA